MKRWKYYRVEYEFRSVVRREITESGLVLVVSGKHYDYIIEEAQDERWAKSYASGHIGHDDRIYDFKITNCERVTKGY